LFGGTPLVSGSSSHDTDGWLAGVQLGAMKQFGSIVVGTEFSLSGADINGNGGNCFGITAATGGAVGSNCSTTVNWLLTGLAKGGFAWDRWMVYGALGYAGRRRRPLDCAHPRSSAAQLVAARHRSRHRLRRRLRLRALRRTSCSACSTCTPISSRGAKASSPAGLLTNGRRDIDLDTITARLSYKWGGDCCAPVPMK
jgi:hypothetical protein